MLRKRQLSLVEMFQHQITELDKIVATMKASAASLAEVRDNPVIRDHLKMMDETQRLAEKALADARERLTRSRVAEKALAEARERLKRLTPPKPSG